MWRPALSFSGLFRTLVPVGLLREHPAMEASAEPVVYRLEVLAIIGALADLVVEVRRIRETVEEDYGEEEAE